MTWSRTTIRDNVAKGKSMRGLKFTAANLAELKSAEREYFAWSQDLPGFGIRILPSGKRSWIVQFRLADGKTVRRTIGSTKVVPATMAEARAQQLLAHARVHRIDLAAQEKADALAKIRRRNTTIGGIASAYLSEPAVRARRSFAETKRYLEVVWRDVREFDAESVDRHALIPVLRQIASARGGVTANRARASLSSMFTWAITHGLLRRDNSPTAFLPSWAEQARSRALAIEELAQVWGAAPAINEVFGRMIRLLALTGCRRSEISDLEWTEIDFARAVIELPGSRTKNSLAHTVPLAPVALEILADVPRRSTARVFSGFRSWSWAKARLDALVSLPAWTVHDIRRSVSTGLHEHLQADPHLVELVINHASGSKAGVAGRYDRSVRLGERRAVLEAWACLILEAAGEPQPAVPANVVRIGR